MGQVTNKVSKRRVYCLGCNRLVKALLVKGVDVEPNVNLIADDFFYQCSTCKGYVGCHKNAKNRTEPLGVIPSEHIRQARLRVYNGFCIVAEHHKCTIAVIYKKLAKKIGKRITIAKIKSNDEAIDILKILDEIYQEKQD